MAALVVEPKSFASERDVVKEELRQNTNARPYGKLFSLYFPAISYTRHPYARGTIGSLDNLQSAQIDDVRAFHATYYRPRQCGAGRLRQFRVRSIEWLGRPVFRKDQASDLSHPARYRRRAGANQGDALCRA